MRGHWVSKLIYISEEVCFCLTFWGHNVEVKFWAIDIGDKKRDGIVFVSNPKLQVPSIPLSSQD